MYCMRGTAAAVSFAVLCSGTVLIGCASMEQKFGDDPWYQKSKETQAKAVTATTAAVNATTTAASKAAQRMQRYLAEKDVLQTFHDAGEHSETAVLTVLHKQGIGGRGRPAAAGKAAAGPSGVPGTAATASASGTGGASKSKNPATQAAPLPVPEQYSGAYRWPLDAGIISSEYGERWGKMHKGLDLAADAGEPVYAVAAGEVIYAGDGLRGYGNVIIMRHDRRISSLYAHNSELKVKQGDQVRQGTLIALLGNTGHSTGPHVHFEIRDGDNAVNPHTMLPQGKLAYAVCAGAACDAQTAPPMLAAHTR
jgi:murein DD-endopeptidase MepM/ murein hydrolase activator NlpD